VRIAPLAASHVSQFFRWKVWSEVRSEGRGDTRVADISSMARKRPALNLKTGKVCHDACERRRFRQQINSSAAPFIKT
jgi:hypothetical protein